MSSIFELVIKTLSVNQIKGELGYKWCILDVDKTTNKLLEIYQDEKTYIIAPEIFRRKYKGIKLAILVLCYQLITEELGEYENDLKQWLSKVWVRSFRFK